MNDKNKLYFELVSILWINNSFSFSFLLYLLLTILSNTTQRTDLLLSRMFLKLSTIFFFCCFCLFVGVLAQSPENVPSGGLCSPSFLNIPNFLLHYFENVSKITGSSIFKLPNSNKKKLENSTLSPRKNIRSFYDLLQHINVNFCSQRFEKWRWQSHRWWKCLDGD